MAIKIYRTSDRIPVQIGEVTFRISPLSQDQKVDLMSCYTQDQGQTIQDMTSATGKLIKYCVKGISGVEYATGEPYELRLENGVLTDECVEEILNLEIKEDLAITCWAFLNGIPTSIKHPETGKAMKGIKILPVEGSDKKKS